MELLAPAGSKESLKAAIIGGADAVYLGGRFFGARGLAENFTNAELGGAVGLAHKHGVKVYVTVNTLIKESELQQVFSYLDYLESIGVDAVIIQDRGLLRIIQENFSIPIHASTQMGIHSPEGAVWAEKNGISRIILARELLLEELKKIREATKLELEVFIHGALCYSFSGQCLFSSALSGKSGNRGLCLQPCRKEYVLGKNRGFLLSTADILGVKAIPELIRIGIEGLKIEGRMRSPLYVYVTSKVYSNAIQRAEAGKEPLITEREKELLEVAFNRGYGNGYLFGEKDVTHPIYAGSRGFLLGKFYSDSEKITIKAENLRLGDGLTLYKDDEKIGGFEVREDDKKDGLLILHPPFNIQSGEYTIYKTRDREFNLILDKIKAMEFPSFSPKKKQREFTLRSTKRKETKGELSFYISSLKSLEKVIPYANRVYFEWNNQFEEASIICEKQGVECVLILPRLSFDFPDTDAESLMINSIDQYQKYSHRKLYGSYYMNFFNSCTIPELFQYILSVENSKDDIKKITEHYKGRLEAMVFGRIELMVSRDNSLEAGVLVDQKRVRFPLYRDRFGFTHILNSSYLFLMDYLEDLEGFGVNSFGIDLRRSFPELAEIVAKAFYERDLSKKGIIKKKCNSITARHYIRGVD
ncbi:MAG: family peptidase [Thermoproteota archaeon]|nr:family peptidase [Thermoproteota archaeon]